MCWVGLANKATEVPRIFLILKPLSREGSRVPRNALTHRPLFPVRPPCSPQPLGGSENSS